MGIELLAAVLAGLIAGAALGYLLWASAATRAQAQAASTAAELAAARARAEGHAAAATRLASLEPERDRLAEELAALEAGSAARETALAEQTAALRTQFDGLAQAAIQQSQDYFRKLSDAALTHHRETADAGLKALLTPVADTLARYEGELKLIETARAEGYGKLTGLLDEMTKGHAASINATARLETALRSSGKAAGRWGEEQCRNVLEMAGLVDGTDFTEQASVEGEAGRQRPDFVVRLPGGRNLVIDVKCSLDRFVAAAEAANEEDRDRALKAHAGAVRAHAVGLAGKAYEKAVPGAVDFVILFVPGENFLAAALQHDRALMNEFMNKRIVLAGPINLIAVARTVAAMRDQARLAKEAEEIARLGRELYDSLRIMSGNIGKVQKSLDAAVCNWNEFTAQLDSRVIRRARRFEALGATTGLDRIADVSAVERTPLLPNDADLRIAGAQTDSLAA